MIVEIGTHSEVLITTKCAYWEIQDGFLMLWEYPYFENWMNHGPKCLVEARDIRTIMWFRELKEEL